MNEKYKKYLSSKTWANIKIELILHRGPFCQVCRKKKHPLKLDVHHLTYENIFNENPEDLMLLCKVCHQVEHGIIKIKPKRQKKVKAILPKRKYDKAKALRRIYKLASQSKLKILNGPRKNNHIE